MSSNLLSSAVAAALVDQNQTKPVVLTKVDVAGGEAFSDNFFNKLLTPLLSSSDLTLGQLIKGCESTFDTLAYTNAFKNISFNIDSGNLSDLKEGNVKSDLLYSSANSDSKPIPVDVKINLDSKKLTNFNLGSIHNEEGHLISAGYTNLNTFGNTELFDVQVLFNLVPENKGRTLNLNYKAPMVDTSLKLFANGLVSNNKQSWASSYQQLITSGMVGLEKTHIFKDSKTNEVRFNSLLTGGFSFTKRSIFDINDAASDSIKVNAGDSIKESLILSGSLDSRKFLPSSLGAFPLSGSFFSMTNELTGFSNVSSDKFLKSTLNAQFNYSALSNWFTLESELGSGAITDLSSIEGSKNTTTSNIHFQDKFYLGGEETVSGFAKNGISIKENQDSVGGNLFWKYNFTLYSRMLFAPLDSPLRLYTRINGGDLYNKFEDVPLSFSSIKSLDLFKKSASSSSIGFVYKVGNDAYFDLHYNIPISNRIGDVTKPGFGFSLLLNGTSW